MFPGGGGVCRRSRKLGGPKTGRMELWVRDPLASGTQLVQWPAGERSVWGLLRARCQAQGLPEDHFYVTYNGHLVNFEDQLQDGAIYSLEPRLCGGKGGFGSMLRALGAQIEKTTNREACRDLSGRRLRDVNHEKAMAEWVKQQAEREADKEQRRLEKLKRKLAEPKHFFTNPVYQQQCHEMAERLEDSVLKGMQASSSTVVSPVNKESQKHPNESERGEPPEKKRCFWLGVEGLEEDPDSSQDSSSSEDDHSPCTSTSCTMPVGNLPDMGDPKEPCPSFSEDFVGCSSSTIAVDQPQEQTEVVEKDDLVEEKIPFCESPPKEECKEAKEEEGQAGPQKFQEPVDQLQGTESTKIDLLDFHSAAELEVLGLDKLKSELITLGLKCGGTLQERAARLFSVRGLSRDQIDPALFAKPSKGKKK